MAGVPAVFQAMVETLLPRLTGGAPLLSATVRIDRGEGDIAGPLADLAKEFDSLSFGSYPFQKDGRYAPSRNPGHGHGQSKDRAPETDADIRRDRFMTEPDADQLFLTLDRTWPAAEFLEAGPWTLRKGEGGGQRVSAATARQPVGEQDVPLAEEGMRDLKQRPLS